MEPVLGLKECEEALKKDPKFLKVWERKGKCHMMMKQFDKAMKAFDEGLKINADSFVCKDGKREAQCKIMGYGQSEEDRKE